MIIFQILSMMSSVAGGFLTTTLPHTTTIAPTTTIPGTTGEPGDFFCFLSDLDVLADSTLLGQCETTTLSSTTTLSTTTDSGTTTPAPGGEMISNGTFTGSTGWTLGADWTLAGNSAVFGGTTTSDISQADGDMIESILPSTDYILTFSVAAESYLAVRRGNGGWGYVAPTTYAAGTHVVPFTSPDAEFLDTAGIAFRGTAGQGPIALDNVSLTLA